MRHWRDQDLWPATEAQTHTYDILKYKCRILEAKWMISQDVQRFKMSDIISHWLLAFYVSKLKSIYRYIYSIYIVMQALFIFVFFIYISFKLLIEDIYIISIF